jgi:hypothetical protein
MRVPLLVFEPSGVDAKATLMEKIFVVDSLRASKSRLSDKTF